MGLKRPTHFDDSLETWECNDWNEESFDILAQREGHGQQILSQWYIALSDYDTARCDV